MKRQPGIALAFVVLGALSFAVLYVLVGLSNGLNRSSDGAPAPLAGRGPSEFLMVMVYASYFLVGVIAAFVTRYEVRWGLAGLVHLVVLFVCIWSTTDTRDPGVGNALSLLWFEFLWIALPMLLWILLLLKREAAP